MVRNFCLLWHLWEHVLVKWLPLHLRSHQCFHEGWGAYQVWKVKHLLFEHLASIFMLNVAAAVINTTYIDLRPLKIRQRRRSKGLELLIEKGTFDCSSMLRMRVPRRTNVLPLLGTWLGTLIWLQRSVHIGCQWSKRISISIVLLFLQHGVEVCRPWLGYIMWRQHWRLGLIFQRHVLQIEWSRL